MAWKATWTNATPAVNASVNITPAAGDILVAWAVTDTSSAGDLDGTPTGWTRDARFNTTTTDAGWFACFSKKSDGTETSVSITSSSGQTSIIACASFDGRDGTTWKDVTPVTNLTNSSGANHDMSITPITNGCDLVFVEQRDDGNSNYTFTFSTTVGTTGAWTTRADLNNGFYNTAMGAAVQVTAGAITARCASTAGDRAGVLYAFRPASSSFDPSTSLVPFQIQLAPPSPGGLLVAIRSGSFFAPTPLPDPRTVQWTNGVFPERADRPKIPITEQQAVASPAWPPDVRKVQWTDGVFPVRVERPNMPPSSQLFTSPRELVMERASVYSDGIEPDAIARRLFPVSEQMVDPILPPRPEQALAFSGSVAPDRVARPVLATSEQQALAAPPAPPDSRTFQYADGIGPDSVRRPMQHATEQQAFVDATYSWSLAPTAPNITPPSWPDTVLRPMFHPTSQPGATPVSIDRRSPQVDGVWPVTVQRPAVPTSEQPSHAAPPWPPDARSVPWSDAIAPSSVRRPVFDVWMQQAFTASLQPEATRAFADAFMPAVMPRPMMPTHMQQAFAGIGVPIEQAPVPDFVAACYPHSVSAMFRNLGIYDSFFFPSVFSVGGGGGGGGGTTGGTRAYSRVSSDRKFPSTTASDRKFPSSSTSHRNGTSGSADDE